MPSRFGKFQIASGMLIALLLVCFLIAKPISNDSMLVYGIAPPWGEPPVHWSEAFSNGTWFEGDNSSESAYYRDWHTIEWKFEEFNIRNWSQNITVWDSRALEWGTLIDTIIPVTVNVTLPFPINLTYKDGRRVQLEEGSILTVPAGSSIQSYYTMGNLGGGICLVYPDYDEIEYSNETGLFNVTQLKNFVVEGFINGKFYRSNVTYVNTDEGRTINWFIGYKNCSVINWLLHKNEEETYNPNPQSLTFTFDIKFDIHILRTANYTKIKSDVDINITRLTLPGNPENTTFGMVLRFSHFVKPVLKGGDPEITINGKDFTFPPEILENETAASYTLGNLKLIDFELPKTFTLYTSNGINKTASVKTSIGWDENAEHPCWTNYMNFDVAFLNLPYGTQNTTRITYDPVITIHHHKNPEPTPLHYLIPLLTIPTIAAIAIITYAIRRRKRQTKERTLQQSQQQPH